MHTDTNFARVETATQKQPTLVRLGLWAAPFLLLLTLFGWALSSPAGSSPDDEFHAASIWCAQGERPALCEQGAKSNERFLPSKISYMVCFAGNPKVDGSCQKHSAHNSTNDMHLVVHGNWNGNIYPPVFYRTMSVFASENVDGSILAMRLVNAFFAVALLTATMIALPKKYKPLLAFSSLLSLVPLGMFLLASINPSSWAILSVAIVLPAMLGAAEASGKRRIALILLSALAAVVGAGARADAAIFVVLASVVGLFLASVKDKALMLLFAFNLGVSALFYLNAGQSSAISSGLGAAESSTLSASVSLLVLNILNLPVFWVGMFNNLGWLDTAISPIALFGVSAALISVLFTSVAKLDKRKAIALSFTMFTFIALPLYMFNASNAPIGNQVQPRYLLPILVMLVAVALVPRPKPLTLSPLQVAIIAILLVGAHTIALYDQFTRYVAGERILNLNNGDWWWEQLFISPQLVFSLSVISFAILVGVLAWKFCASSETVKSEQMQLTKTLNT